MEVTLTTPRATEAIRRLADDSGLVVGAGTVLRVADVQAVADAGGRFVLSPVFDPDVVDEAHRLRLLAVPGAGTAGELLAAHRHGATVVKFFPSGALGGPAFMRAVRGPLPDIAIIPTSGPTSENLAEYVAAGAVAVGVGSEVVSPGYTLDGIEAAARRVAAAMVAARAAR
jgi:2-dehydro-3-deoxyphosphogluconate aldolase/(4S)-4-hydroxy-2-oxoglutarate aldolase